MPSGIRMSSMSPGHLHDLRPTDLLTLVRRIAVEDRHALGELYEALSARLTAQLLTAPLIPRLAGAMVSGTFVEVWWLARFHTAPGTDVLGWVASIAGRRVAEWNRSREPDPAIGASAAVLLAPQAWIVDGADSYYRHTDLALFQILDPLVTHHQGSPTVVDVTVRGFGRER